MSSKILIIIKFFILLINIIRSTQTGRLQFGYTAGYNISKVITKKIV